MPQITIDGPLSGVLTQFVPAVVLWPGPNGNRHEQFSHLRRREIKVPSPPTREGRGEGNVRVKFPFWSSQVAARSHSCSSMSRREDHLPQILNGVATRGGTVGVHALANVVTRITPDNAQSSPLPDPHRSGERGLVSSSARCIGANDECGLADKIPST